MSQIASTSSAPAVAANFMDPVTAANESLARNPPPGVSTPLSPGGGSTAQTLATTNAAAATGATPGKPTFKFTISVNQGHATASTAAAAPSTSATGNVLVAPSPSSTVGSSNSSTTPSPTKFVIVNKKSAATNVPSTSSTTQVTTSSQSSSTQSAVSASSPTPDSSSNNLLQLNDAKPLEKSSPALLAMAAAAVADISPPPPTSSRKLATIESASEVDVPLPTNLPASHPAAFARPPTPPTPKDRSKSRRSRSRTPSVSPAMRGRRGSDSTQLPPHLAMGMSPLGSARDTFKLPGSAVISPSASIKVDQFNPLLDGGETEFSQALRAALAEAGTVASPSGAEGASAAAAPTEVLSPRNRRTEDENASASRTPADANSSNVTPTEEATERELRKQAIRQKNAMHMRIRNAGAAPAASHSRAPSVNRAAMAAAAAAAASGNAPEGKSGPTAGGVMRSSTFNPARSSGGNGTAGALQMTELPSMIVEGQESKTLTSPIPSSDFGVIVPADPSSSPVKRTRSSILKNPLSNINPSPISTSDEPVKRTRSGVMRVPSLKTGATVMPMSDNAAKNTPTEKGVVRTGTVNSRVGFVVPIGEGNDTDSSSSSSDDETSPKPKRVIDPDAAAETSMAPASPSHHASSAGIPSLHATARGEGRTHIFMKQGSQLVLTSVSAAGSNQSNQAANVMVMSVSSIFTRLRLYTDLCFFLSMIGVVLTIVNKEVHYAYPDDSTADTLITVIRFLTSASTIALIACLYQYYKADFQFLQLNRVYLLRSAVWNTQLISRFILEVLICLIHEPPFLHHDVDMSISDTATIQSLSFEGKTIIEPVIVRNPWSLLVVARIYFVLRLVLSRYYTGGTKILGLWFNFNFNIPFAIRNMLYSHPLLSLAPVVGILIFSCSYSLWVFEREVPDRHFSFGTALWVVCITLTSVGYGDITPMSSGGRAICILSAFIGIMVTAVLVAAVHQKLTLLPYEGRMVEFLERDSNSSLLKYYASRCISRSWKYYHYRKKCVRLVAEREFTFVSRSNLLRCKTIMLQGIFDFQTARKQIQAYDRRYHSEQLFRSMLEGLYDKLEAMTLDFHVLEDEFDISYEEQRKLGHKQAEILEEVKGLAKRPIITEGTSNAPAATDATPEKGRLSLLRTTSMPVNPTAVPAPEIPLLTRPPSEVSASAAVSGRQSADEGGISLSEQVRHTRHKSLKHVRMSEDASEGEGEHTHGGHHHHAHFHVDTHAPAPAAAAAANAPSPAAGDAPKQPRSILINPRRASTLGGLDLTAAVNAASEKAAAAASSGSGASSPPNAMRARSSGDLLSHVVVETPSANPQPRNADTPTSSFFPTLARRTSTASADVTADLLSVVQALSTPTSNPSDVSAGRIRFGESDFAAHRAAAAVKSNRRTVVLPRGQTLLQGTNAVLVPDTKEGSPGAHRLHHRQSSIGDGLANASPPILVQQSSVTHQAGASDDRTSSPTGANKPHFPRAPSSGSTLRVVAATRAASHAHANSEQMDKMFVLLMSVSDRLATLESKLARPHASHHPHSHSHSVHVATHSAQASPLSLAASNYNQGFDSQPVSQPAAVTPTTAAVSDAAK